MSSLNANRVLELAARHDFMILEDDIYGESAGPPFAASRQPR